MGGRMQQNRRMAGKKGAMVQLQLEVNTEDEWRKLLTKEGLIVVDVYSDWCGPCIGMVGNLKKIKLDIGGDMLMLAMARSDEIKCLERFRNKSEPTWMFIANGHLVNLMFGANAPRLAKLIIQELENEKKVLAGEKEREWIPFDELTEEEKIREKKKEEKRLAEMAKEQAEIAAALAVRLQKIVLYLERCTQDYTIIILMPYIIVDVKCEAYDALMAILLFEGYSAIAEVKADIDSELLSQLMSEGDLEVSGEMKEELAAGPCLVKLLKRSKPTPADNPEEPPPEDEEQEAEPPPVEEDVPDALVRVTQLVYTNASHSQEDKQRGVTKQAFLQRYSKTPEVPAMWTASTPRAKARAIYQFFPKFCEQFALPEPIPLPPHLTLIFDTVKKTDVVECALEYGEDLLHLGFFSSSDPDKTELLASSLQEFELIKNKKGGEALVMVISKIRNEPLLSLSQFAPIYISPNIEDGDRMRRLFFPTHEEDEDDNPGKDGGINESDASSDGMKHNQDQPEDGKALSGASPHTSTDDQVET